MADFPNLEDSDKIGDSFNGKESGLTAECPN
jgi:hypothetical protein